MIRRPALSLCLSILTFATLPAICFSQDFDPPPKSLTVMTWNVEWMFDENKADNESELAKEQSSPSKAYWQNKVAAVAEVIMNSGADIVALQEIESDKTLSDIANMIASRRGPRYRYAFVQGSDRHTEQDVGILQKSGLWTFSRKEQTKKMFDSNQYYNLSKHLFAEFRWSGIASPLTVLNVHFRAKEEAEEFRIRQARLARAWLNTPLNAGQDVILLGDLNCEHKANEPSDDIAEIVGKGNDPKMVDLFAISSNPSVQTHTIINRQFDRIIVSESMIDDAPGEKDWVFAGIDVLTTPIIRGKPDGEAHWDQRLTLPLKELDISDHYPVVAKFQLK